MTIVLFAEGFEEVEALTVVDILRRSAIETLTVSIAGERTVTGAHGIPVVCDRLLNDIAAESIDCTVLPGGMPGTANLGASEAVRALLRQTYEAGKLVCAICAAPSVLGQLGFLQGKRAVCYPGFEEMLTGAQITAEPVVRDGQIITGKAAGSAAAFAREIADALGYGEQGLKAYAGMYY